MISHPISWPWPKRHAKNRVDTDHFHANGFHGGLTLDTNKRALRITAIRELGLPEQLVIPLLDYHQNALEPIVSIHQNVVRGEALASNIVAPADATVVAIEPRAVIHPGGLSANCIVLDCHNQQTSSIDDADSVEPQDAIASFLTHAETVLARSAIIGLGGAAFPTAAKISSAECGVETLIINAAECEPEIACDEALMQNESDAIVYGIDALVRLTQSQRCIIAIEDSKPLAIEKLNASLSLASFPITLAVLPTRYPTGAESPLIETLTGKRIQHGHAPSAQGIVCVNVGTVYALWQAIYHHQALDSRVISLGGRCMPNPCNVRVRFGTPVSHVLKATNNLLNLNDTRIRVGGPLSGFDLSSLDVPVTAKTNCILAERKHEEKPAQACIRCGQCAEVCPARLLPQQLHWYAQSDDHEKCAQLHLASCIECGCCDLVCPSSIKLTETFRYAKSQARAVSKEHERATLAELRFKEREQRLAQRELARQAAIEARKQALKNKNKPDKDRISAALERARSKRKPSKE